MQIVAFMKDPEFAHVEGVAPDTPFIHGSNNRARRDFTPKRVLSIIGAAALLIGVMFGVGILASCVRKFPSSRRTTSPHLITAPTTENKFHSTDTGDRDFSLAPSVFNEQAQMARQIAPRADDCDHDEMTVDPMASLVVDRAVDAGGQTLPVLIATDEGVRIPIS